MYAVITLAWVLKIRKPVPSKSFINEPVQERRPSGKSTRRPPFWRYSAMCLTANGELMSTGIVRWLIIIRLWNQLASAAMLDVTKRQSSSRQAPMSSQSHHETWLGSNKTGPGVSSDDKLYARNRYRMRISQRRRVLMGLLH